MLAGRNLIDRRCAGSFNRLQQARNNFDFDFAVEAVDQAVMKIVPEHSKGEIIGVASAWPQKGLNGFRRWGLNFPETLWCIVENSPPCVRR